MRFSRLVSPTRGCQRGLFVKARVGQVKAATACVSASALVFQGVAVAGPLLREDNNRSQFAGQELKRVGAYGQESVPMRDSREEGSGALSSDKRNQTSYGSGQAASARAHELSPFAGARGSRNAQPVSPALKNIPVQSVFLNGENIIGLRNQVLKGVDIRFDAQGNIFIDAPHYQIQYDTTYHPLLPEELPALQKERALPPVDAAAAEPERAN